MIKLILEFLRRMAPKLCPPVVRDLTPDGRRYLLQIVCGHLSPRDLDVIVGFAWSLAIEERPAHCGCKACAQGALERLLLGKAEEIVQNERPPDATA